MKTLGIIIIIVLIYIIWQYQELQRFKVTNYSIKTSKIAKPLRIALIADFHSHEFGRDNERLMAKIRGQKPDLIVVPGDMIISGKTEAYYKSLRFFKELSELAPVYFGNGNHESRIEKPDSLFFTEYTSYKQKVEQLGVYFVNNETEQFRWGETEIDICGADIPIKCYEKRKSEPLPQDFLKNKLGTKNRDRFTILLAHNPAFSEEYAAWGAELIVAGHTHGGLIRIPGLGSLISPQLTFFPKYDAGRFDLGKSTVIISKGLGTHTFHIRIFDRAEVVMIQLETEG